MAAAVGFTPPTGLDLAFGPGAGAAVASAKLLVVGAGGIGCELLKNLAATGFTGVTLIDLDSIDVSNLNRQFLFRRRHVGAPKADTAAAAVEGLVPGAAVAPRVGNIKDKAFDADYFRRFVVVLNALDNVEARRHVNRLCLAAGVPLVDSGSTGYDGHVAVIKGGATECYDCTLKGAQKVYAVCTIRSTPDKPVHCVVWAKALYDLMFGPADASNVLADLDGGGVHAAAGEAGDGETGAGGGGEAPLSKVANGGPPAAAPAGDEVAAGDATAASAAAPGVSAPAAAAGGAAPLPPAGTSDSAAARKAAAASAPAAEAAAAPSTSGGDPTSVEKDDAKRVRYDGVEEADAFVARVAHRVFHADVAEQAAMTELWAKREPPIPLDVAALAATTTGGGGPWAGHQAVAAGGTLDLLSQTAWDVEASAAALTGTLTRLVATRSAAFGTLTFDKDDADALAFVTAASNLRSAAYGVPLQSPWAVKGIAGNIVHAIATTNAVVAGLLTLEAVKVVAAMAAPGEDLSATRSIFVLKEPSGDGVKGRPRRLCMPERLAPPAPGCYVCSSGQLTLRVDAATCTLRTLVEGVLRGELGVLEPQVSVSGPGDYHNTLYECGEGLEADEVAAYEAALDTPLATLRAGHGAALGVEDFAQALKVTLHVAHVEGGWEEEAHPRAWEVVGRAPAAAAAAAEAPAAAAGAGAAAAAPAGPAEDADELEIVEPAATAAAAAEPPAKKRRRDDPAAETEAGGAKKAKPAPSANGKGGEGDDAVWTID